MKKSTIVEIISLLFVILFLYTGISKLMEYDVAREQIALTPLLAPVAKYLVFILPITEIIVSILLFLPRTRRLGLYASLALMIAFTGYVVYILNYNAELPCTCGGVLQQMTWPQHLVFNGVAIVLVLTGIVLGRRIHSGLPHAEKSLAHS
jgi:uncharacterized membrane protein YphA (DoxX/SURF4 family)